MKLARLVKSATLAFFLIASVASAQIPARFADDPIILKIADQLAEQGFEIIEVKITLLGRYRIEAIAPGYIREIVLAPGAGTILRDHWRETENGDSAEMNDNEGDDSDSAVNGENDSESEDETETRE